MKIVSLVPSLTEYLYDLGLEQQIVGRTKFCIHPAEKIKSATIVGGTKKIHIERVRALQPDLVIANKEENTKEDVTALMEFSDVLVTEISDVDGALIALQNIADAVSKSVQGSHIIEKISNSFSMHPRASLSTVCYLIWQEPYMSVGRDTFIHDMLSRCGFINVFAEQHRYPTTSIEELAALKPAYIFLSSEPFPFKKKHVDFLSQRLPYSKTILVDGEYFSWYGSRMLRAIPYLNDLVASITRLPDNPF